LTVGCRKLKSQKKAGSGAPGRRAAAINSGLLDRFMVKDQFRFFTSGILRVPGVFTAHPLQTGIASWAFAIRSIRLKKYFRILPPRDFPLGVV